MTTPTLKPAAPRTARPAPIAPTANGAAPKPAPQGPVAKLLALEGWVNKRMVGRTDLIRDFLLAIVARTNCLFIGPPGVGKTQAVELVATAFAGQVFSTMLTKFTKPSEVFGPTDIAALEQGEQRIKTDGFLPAAVIGIIDEVFKGSSAILNSTLTIANERRFKNGAGWDSCPTRALVGMSNEFPEEPAILAAFFDRFPSKRMVPYLDADGFAAMLETVEAAARAGAKSVCPAAYCLDDADFAALDALVAAVKIGPDILGALGELRAILAEKAVVISDRRYVQALKLLRASAVLAKRAEVTRTDLKVLEQICWNTEADRAVIAAALPQFENPFARQLREIVDELSDEMQKVITAANVDPVSRKPIDPAAPSPNMPAAASAGAKAYNAAKTIGVRLESIEDMADTDEDKALLARAKTSAEETQKLVRSLMTGKDTLNELLAADAAGRDLALDLPQDA